MIQSAARERALDYLAAHRVMTLATHGPDGPWAAAVFYANDGFELYFLSSPASRHGRNLALRAGVAAALARVRWYRLAAARAYFVDNSAGFGHRDQVL